MNGRRQSLLRTAALLGLVLVLLGSASLALADGAGKATLPPGASRGDDPNHTHYFSDWSYYQHNHHRATCDYPGCTRWIRIMCTDCRIETGSYEFSVCPICGRITGGPLDGTDLPMALQYDAHITRNPNMRWMGTPKVRMGQIDENTVVMLMCYDIYGSCVRNDVELTLTLSYFDSMLLKGMTLTAVGGSAEMADTFTVQDGCGVFRIHLVNRPAAIYVFERI